MSLDVTSWIQHGWKCPQCSNVFSPTTSMCYICHSKLSTSTTSTSTSDNTNIFDRHFKPLDYKTAPTSEGKNDEPTN